MPLYDHETFDTDLLPGTLKKAEKDAIRAAVMLGWKVHISGRQTCTLVPPDGQPQSKRFHFGVSGKRINLTRMKRDIIKYADPELLRAVEEEDVTVTVPMLGDPGTVVDDRPESDTSPTKADIEREERRARSQTVNDPRPARHIVDQRPMLAARGHSSNGKSSAYYSDTTIERRWSDRSVDYACAAEGCDYTSDSRTSPSRHYAATHSRTDGKVPQRSSFRAEVPERAVYDYQPRDARVDALAEAISELMAQGGRSPREIAEAALKWVHEQRHTHLSADHEPLTPEEQIARIKTILDDGTMFNLDQQTREQADRIAELEGKVVEAEARAEQAEAKYGELSSNMQALRELVDGLGEAS